MTGRPLDAFALAPRGCCRGVSSNSRSSELASELHTWPYFACAPRWPRPFFGEARCLGFRVDAAFALPAPRLRNTQQPKHAAQTATSPSTSPANTYSLFASTRNSAGTTSANKEVVLLARSFAAILVATDMAAIGDHDSLGLFGGGLCGGGLCGDGGGGLGAAGGGAGRGEGGGGGGDGDMGGSGGIPQPMMRSSAAPWASKCA
eukprot:scaffold107039_cov61-Phaeocystis_antarctica.AAC.4